MLQHFASLRLDEANIFVQSNPPQPWSTTSELLIPALTVYKQMIKETGVFIEESMQEIDAMVCPFLYPTYE